MEPRIVIDRSALQKLGAEALDELTLWFDVVATPTLIHEVISNLRKTNPLKKGKRLPVDVLRSIASFLSRVHPVCQPRFEKWPFPTPLVGSCR